MNHDTAQAAGQLDRHPTPASPKIKTRRNSRRWRVGALAVLVGALVLGATPNPAAGSQSSGYFDRWDPETPSPTGQTVVQECNPSDTTDPQTWSEATASIRLRERSGRSTITLTVRNARPDTLYTVWLRLSGVDSNGNPYGGSPLTGLPVTPLTASGELPSQLSATLPNAGSDALANGFRTNDRGTGHLTLAVDFPITSGAYPFQRFADFDQHQNDVALTNAANVARLGGQAAAIRPVAIPDGSQAPATILIASHCVDDIAHGLIPGPHENWFLWSAE